MVQGTTPILIETDFRISFTDFYNSIFGPGKAESNDQHEENHNCGEQITELLESYSRRFLRDVKYFLDLQTVSYIRSAINVAETANSTTVLTHGQPRTTRDLGLVAVSMAVVSLVTSVSSLLFFNHNYNEMVEQLQDLYQRIDEDRKNH